MKIVERRDWKHPFTCRKCKSKLECEVDDVKYGVSGMDAEGGFYCECVVCGKQQALMSWDLPDGTAEKVRSAFEKRSRGR